MSNSVATLDSEKALDVVKRLNDTVGNIAERSTKFEEQVGDVYKKTNMPFIEQMMGFLNSIKVQMQKAKETTENICDIVQKYSDAVDEIAEDDGGLGSLNG